MCLPNSSVFTSNRMLSYIAIFFTQVVNGIRWWCYTVIYLIENSSWNRVYFYLFDLTDWKMNRRENGKLESGKWLFIHCFIRYHMDSMWWVPRIQCSMNVSATQCLIMCLIRKNKTFRNSLAIHRVNTMGKYLYLNGNNQNSSNRNLSIFSIKILFTIRYLEIWLSNAFKDFEELRKSVDK